jgi:hypothetical protein
MAPAWSTQWGYGGRANDTPHFLLSAIVEALRNAGATEEMIASATKAAGELQLPTQGAAAGGASMQPGHYAIGLTASGKKRDETPACDEMRDEIPARPLERASKLA